MSSENCSDCGAPMSPYFFLLTFASAAIVATWQVVSGALPYTSTTLGSASQSSKEIFVLCDQILRCLSHYLIRGRVLIQPHTRIEEAMKKKYVSRAGFRDNTEYVLVDADYSVVVVTKDGQEHSWSSSLAMKSLAKNAVESGKWVEVQAA